MKNTHKFWWLHLWKTICKFKVSLVIWGALFLFLLLVTLLFELQSDNVILSVLLGANASILATVVYRIADFFEESYNAHKELVQIANEFCYFAENHFPLKKQCPKDYNQRFENYLAELHCKQTAMRDLYSKLIEKKHYNCIAKEVAQIYVAAQERRCLTEIKRDTATLKAYLSELR